MKFRLLSLGLLFLSGVISAHEINSPPPVDLLLLEYKKVFDSKAAQAAHGIKEYCYKINDIYVVYSESFHGDGYSFLSDKPKQKCVPSKSNVSSNNMLGLTVGTSKQKASELVSVKLAEGDNIIIWHYQRPIHNLPYDDMTTLNIIIKNGLVYSVRLFNTVTS